MHSSIAKKHNAFCRMSESMLPFLVFICLWIVCIILKCKGLILNGEPYYNEAGYEKQKGSQQGLENSRMYNELAILKMVQVIRYVYSTSSRYLVSHIEDGPGH